MTWLRKWRKMKTIWEILNLNRYYTMAKYDADTQHIFVNTEDLASTDGGDQVNRFKLNLGTNPISSDDNSLIKVSLTQFNMAKNFYNVNSSNNSLRLYLEGFTHNSCTFGTIDKMIKIPPGDYVSFEVILLNLCNLIQTEMLAAAASGVGVAVVPLGNTTQSNGNANFNGDDAAEGLLNGGDYGRDLTGNDGMVHPNEHIHQYNTGIYAISIIITKIGVSTNFDATDSAVRFPIIQGLHIPPSAGQVVLSTGTILTADEQFSDSYNLFGIPRTTEFVETPPENQGDKMGIIKGFATSGFCLGNQFPRNQGLNTCEYVYLRANLANNIATTNLEAISHDHQGNSAGSHILGKIPRIGFEGGFGQVPNIHFRSDRETGYSMIITANQINEIVFSITDKSGRVIPQADIGVLVRDFGDSSKFEAFTKKINVDGNLFCDFTLKVERIAIPNPPNVLQGTNDIKRFPVNPIQASIPIDFKSNCGF